MNLIGARTDLSPLADSALGPGVLAGAIPQATIDEILVPAMTSGIEDDVGRDCSGVPPDCNCATGSAGAAMLSEFDSNGDCEVTVAEVRQQPAVGAMLAPDVTIDGVPGLSVGVRFSAVSATFTPP